MILPKYSMGIGDRFGRQGAAQLQAIIEAESTAGVAIAPVWNKSHREHAIIGTAPADTRGAAETAVAACAWEAPYFIDADHIGLGNVDGFLGASNFFTLDVADFIGQKAGAAAIGEFVSRHADLAGSLTLPVLGEAVEITPTIIEAAAGKYLRAVGEAGRIYRHIERAKGAGSFVVEVSMDECEQPQTPVELLIILAAVADEGIPAQTIAPKFSGRFNKGVDYVGDVTQFTAEFEQDLAVIAMAAQRFDLPGNLKLSVHSGSDKFAIYGPIRRAMKKLDAGLHLKTAGTTWLEELIGLAEAGGTGLALAKEVYARALDRFDELCGPYATVIDIDRSALPGGDAVGDWDGAAFAAAVRHDQSCDRFDPNVRQLLHVGYKIAAEMGPRYLDALATHEQTISRNVTENLLDRHIRAVFT